MPSKKDKKSTGKRIKKAVVDSGMRQPEVAEQAKMSPRHLHKLKTGLANPSIKALARIGRVLGKPVEWFKRKNGDKEGR